MTLVTKPMALAPAAYLEMTEEVAVGTVTETAAKAMVVIRIVKGITRSAYGYRLGHHLVLLVTPMNLTKIQKTTTLTPMTTGSTTGRKE